MTVSVDGRLLELIGDVLGLLELAELRQGLLVALDRAVPSEWVSINEIGPQPSDMHSVLQPPVPDRLHGTWAEYGHQNPLIERFARTRDSRAYRISDVLSRDQFHSLPLYRKFYAQLNVEYQIAFVIEVSPPRYVAVALSRSARDFTDSERAMLDRARPYLIQIYRAAIAHSALTESGHAAEPADLHLERLLDCGLTHREASVLSHVARGQSNKDIAAELEVSERTIGKHLQRCYRKLGATNRSDAAAIAWRLHSMPKDPTTAE